MRTYEVTILVPQGPARADYEGTIAGVKAVFETEGATWIELEKWEERKLAYPVKGETAALYLNGYFRAPNEAIVKIERRAQLSDVILRQLIIARDGKAYDTIREQRAKAAEAAAAAALAAAEAKED
jgi:ribosomal protein S6